MFGDEHSYSDWFSRYFISVVLSLPGLPRVRRIAQQPVADPPDLLALFGKLDTVGNDRWPYSAMKTPTLVFEAVDFAGLADEHGVRHRFEFGEPKVAEANVDENSSYDPGKFRNHGRRFRRRLNQVRSCDVGWQS